MSDFVHNQGYIYPISNEEYEKLDEKYFDLEANGYDLAVFEEQKGLNRYLVFLTYHSYGKKHDNFGSSRHCTELEIKRHIKKFQDVLCKEIDKNKLKYIEYCWYNCSECFDYYEEEEYKPMTIDEAIQHCHDVANIQHTFNKEEQRKCSEEHEQLAAWLTKLQGYEDDTPLTEEFFERNGFSKDFREETEIEPSGEIWCYRTPEYHITAEDFGNFDNDWLVQANGGTVYIDTIGQLRMFLSLCGFDNIVKFKS